MIVPITNLADPAQATLFDKTFALYERMFPEHERHAYTTLTDSLRRNDVNNPRAFWLAAVEGDSVMGGIGAYIASGHPDADKLITMAYMFVVPEARGQGLARKLEQALVDYAGAEKVLIICDVEDPAKMVTAGVTKAEYAEAAAYYNITPFERLVFWRDRMGYRGTDFPYVLWVNRPGAGLTSILTLHARLIENGVDRVPEKLSAQIVREAAAFINCECPYAEIPDAYRNHPGLQSIWAWPENNAYVRISPSLAAEFDHLKNYWALNDSSNGS